MGWIWIHLELLPEIKFWILSALCSPGRTCWWWWRSWMAESWIWIRIRIRIDLKCWIRNQCGSETLLYCFCLCKYVGWIQIRLELLPEIKFWILSALCSPRRTCWWWWRSWMAESWIWIRIRIRIDLNCWIRNQCGSETLLYCFMLVWDGCEYAWSCFPKLNIEYAAPCSPGRTCWWWWRSWMAESWIWIRIRIRIDLKCWI